MDNWNQINSKFSIIKKNIDVLFLDEVQFMNPAETIENVENYLNLGVDVIWAG